MSLYAPLLALLETRRLIADLRSGSEAAEAVRAAGDDSRTAEEEEEERRRRRRIVGEHGGREPAWFAAVVAAMPPGLPFGGDGGIPPKGVPSGDAGDGSSSTVGNSDAFRNQGLEPWWTQLAGTWEETDVLTHTAGGPPAILQYNQTLVAAVTRSDIGIVVAGDGSQAVGARLSFAGGLLSGYVMRAEVGNHRLYRYDAGVATLLRTYAGAITAADTMGIFCSGNTIRGRKNATNLASSTDATYPTGFTGIISFAAGAQFSSWATNL